MNNFEDSGLTAYEHLAEHANGEPCPYCDVKISHLHTKQTDRDLATQVVGALRTALAESRAREERLQNKMNLIDAALCDCECCKYNEQVLRAAPAPASREGETSETLHDGAERAPVCQQNPIDSMPAGGSGTSSRSIWDNPKSNWTKPLPDRESFVDPKVSSEAIRDPSRGRDPSGGEGADWRRVTEDTAFARPFGTVRQCLDCGCLVGGGPSRCVRCAERLPRDAAPAQAPDPSGGEETAWVIEALKMPLGLSRDGACHRWVTFTDSDLWRFQTKEAAESEIRARGLTDVAEARSHGWVPRPAPAQAPDDAERAAREWYRALWVDNGTHSEAFIIGRLAALLRARDEATIERCAQAVDGVGNRTGWVKASTYSDAIRALKKPGGGK